MTRGRSRVVPALAAAGVLASLIGGGFAFVAARRAARAAALESAEIALRSLDFAPIEAEIEGAVAVLLGRAAEREAALEAELARSDAAVLVAPDAGGGARDGARRGAARALARVLAERCGAVREGARGAAPDAPLRFDEILAGTAGALPGILLTALALALHRRSVVAPLRDLASAMDETASGTTRRVVPGGFEALSLVQHAFNRMADEVDRARRDLTSRVDAKTVALTTALDEQRRLNERLRQVLDELREAQERLVRQEKLAAVGTLAGGVAHEFNNLLGGIRGCASEALAEASDPELRETLGVVLRAAERGRTIVDGLLRFSRGAARAPVVIDPAVVVRETRELLAPSATERGVELVVLAAEGACVRADPVELHQVVTNLVKNAIEASPRGGRVELRVAAPPGSKTVALEVSDQGAGIPDASARRVFEPFFTTKEREGGTGLGLAIVHGIVAALGGTLGFAPRPAGGTVFRVELPRVPIEETSVG